MSHKKISVMAYISIAALLFQTAGMRAEAVSLALPSGGVDLTFTSGSDLGSVVNGEEYDVLSLLHLSDFPELQAQIEKEKAEESLYRNLVIAQVNDYVNVRNMPGEEGEIVGKLYDDSVGNFISEENGWYQIKSGNVTGYVKAEYCVTGEEAVALAKEVGTRFAKVNTTSLKVRKEPDLEAKVLGMVPIEDELLVGEEVDGWVQVDVEAGMGWVSKDYVELHTEFVQAESKAEEEARIAKENEERRKAREAARAHSQQTVTATSTQTVSSNVTVSGDGMGASVAEYALQFVGNPYVYGGSSLTNGTDCSGFVMSVYANFGVSLPHSSTADRSQGASVDGLANAQAGDIICYSGHVGIYIGDGKIVHASNEKTGIIVSNADYKTVLAVRRIF